ncbi:MAG: hypothetical protein NTX17_10405 [Candidatus Eisenbacteria bacterium]|nr:hypothetical protein [Candidatus Eisenbacteria bacterium]
MRTSGISVEQRPAAQFPTSTFGTASAPRASRFLLSVVSPLLFALVFLVVLPGMSAGDIDWSLGDKVARKPSRVELSPLERGSVNDLWVAIISGHYHVGGDFVNSLYDRGYSFDEIVPMLEMAKASKKDPSEIVILRRKGLDWNGIARKLGVRPAAMEKAKGKDLLFKRYVLAQCLADYYGIRDSEGLALLNEKGYGFGEIAIGVNVCANSGAPLRDVIATRATGARWRIVAEKVKMPPGKLGKPPAGYSGEKAKDKGSGKAPESTGKKKDRTADCSKTCPKKCY